MPRILIVFLFINILPVYSLDLPSMQIADDSLLRIKLKDSWLTETPARVLAQPPTMQYLQNGERVEVRTEEGKDEFMVILSRELMGGRIADGANQGIARFGTGQFPGWAQGSWVLIRRKDTGAGTKIRIFLRSDQYTYLEFKPFNAEKCQMDVILYDGQAVSSLPIAVSFERLYTMPVNETLKLIESRFPRRYFDPDPADYAGQRKFIARVSAHLPELQFANDGAIDENGAFVYIETLQPQKPLDSAGLNCSGFVKWLIDGILRPVTGERLSIQPLKEPFGTRGSSFTEAWEKIRDPYFGLDWIRNLASTANGILRSPEYSVINEFEVRDVSFSSLLVQQKKTFTINSYPGFLEDAGYGIEGLHVLLYTLAIDEPFKFYLAAVNTEIGERITAANPRGTPHFRQYFHTAALVPYFDEHGSFRVAVFESARETSFNSFRNRYPKHYVNLVKIPVVTAFEP